MVRCKTMTKRSATVAKPDDRLDNVEKLQDIVQDTVENMRESRDYLKAHADEISSEERSDLEAKNRRREESMEGLRSEIKDEASRNQ